MLGTEGRWNRQWLCQGRRAVEITPGSPRLPSTEIVSAVPSLVPGEMLIR